MEAAAGAAGGSDLRVERSSSSREDAAAYSRAAARPARTSRTPPRRRGRARRRAAACLHMVKRSGNGAIGGLWQKGHGLSVGSEAKGPSSRVRRAASSLQMQPHEPLVASCGATKTPL